MSNVTFEDYCTTLDACDDARAFVRGKTLAVAWATCERPDWMLWLLRNATAIDKTTSVRLAVKFVERAARRNPPAVAPVLTALTTWLADPSEANLELVRAAGRNARGLRNAAAYAAAAAAYAAYAAAAAAAYAAYAAAYAAAAAAAAARKLERQAQADIIRELIPVPVLPDFNEVS